MKKHTAMFLTFSALLTLNAYAPQVLWEGSKLAARFPANDELEKALSTDEAARNEELKTKENELKLSKLSIEIEELRSGIRSGKFEADQDAQEEKLQELVEKATTMRAELRKKVEVKELVIPEFKHEAIAIDPKIFEIIDVKPEERAQINLEIKHEKIAIDKAKLESLNDLEVTQCAKEEKSENLEEKIKKLVADKEAIMKEIEELKKSRSASSETDEQKEFKEFKAAKKAREAKAEVVPKHQYSSDYMSLLSEMTSFMMSQQQQQAMMMQQMFSMFAPAQKNQGIEAFYSPYSFTPSRLEMSYEQYPLGYSRHQIGIDYIPHYNEQTERQPSAYSEQASLQQQHMQSQLQQQMQVPSLTPINHDGFNFGQSMTNFNRVQF